MLDSVVHDMRYYMIERENVRELKELGKPKPWTDDPILRRYRFCNVRRNDDKVSRWIYENWIAPNEGSHSLVQAIILARMVNWPDTLEEIGFPEPWDEDKVAQAIRARMDRGDKTWTGAYMITAESNGNPKEVSVCKTVSESQWLILPYSCIDAWKALKTLSRVGSFMAAQFVADLKRTYILGNAVDRDVFCAPGPGSMKGLNLLLGLDLYTNWSQPAFQKEVNELKDVLPYQLDAQDIQNNLCEFYKYCRGSSRSTYPGE